MSELKPKKDDQQVGEDVGNKVKTGDSPKPNGDKLQHAVNEASKKPFLQAIPHVRAALRRLWMGRNPLASTPRWWP